MQHFKRTFRISDFLVYTLKKLIYIEEIDTRLTPSFERKSAAHFSR